MVAYAVAGTILASRRPVNPVGWFLLTIGLVTAVRGLAGEYARYALAGPHHPGHPGGVWAAWYVGWSLTLLFPDGALVTALVVGVYLGCVALLTKVLPVRGGAVQPAAPTRAGRGRPAVQPGPL
jgi:hypothetical protein